MRHLGSPRGTGPELDRLLAAARRSEVVQDMLRRMRQEVLPARGMQVALRALAAAAEAEGAALFTDGPAILYQTGAGANLVMEAAATLIKADLTGDPAEAQAADGTQVLACRLSARFGETAGLALWRGKSAPAWQENDRLLAEAASSILGLVLEHQEIQREMARHSRTDHLTGLLNRRAFYEELPRHIDRLEREQLPGTLILADLDGLRAVNERLGLLTGDRALLCAAQMFRVAVRPTDLVARLGADDFAFWLNGADHLTAAVRAEQLRIAVPERLAEAIGSALPRLTLSIGIATRPYGSDAPPDDVMRRAELTLQQVKRDARGHWRVARQDAA